MSRKNRRHPAMFYAVAQGGRLGIYTTWAEAERECSGFPNNRHARFKTRAEAQAYLDRFVSADSASARQQDDSGQEQTGHLLSHHSHDIAMRAEGDWPQVRGLGSPAAQGYNAGGLDRALGLAAAGPTLNGQCWRNSPLLSETDLSPPCEDLAAQRTHQDQDRLARIQTLAAPPSRGCSHGPQCPAGRNCVSSYFVRRP
ncbi:hypothetical protein BCV69DRAFT_173131 [Microstroma glucosiphilum]|uniref:Ribonuclease H1 N-terminal domain-containing protein n=1 Tax=Pseudomicrostroma glucosiphilum TaxID=1684307 RepID=A0A316U8G9_9BASI|nr:hypothetical protein BCV69DRAFT_173131 [Pseudomicrostroma glucosiphilum]PWN21540.1 hypothetical protein BCV69DRAFT_173131 [Pseudomicrostroma glucosiphilum]